MPLPPFPTGFTEAVGLMNRGAVKEARQRLVPMAAQYPQDLSVVVGAILAIANSTPPQRWYRELASYAQPGTPELPRFIANVRREVSCWMNGKTNELQRLHQEDVALMGQLNNLQLEYRTLEEAANLAGVFRNAGKFYETMKGFINLSLPPHDKALPKLHMIGDSHVLSPHHQTVGWQGQYWQVESHFCLGCKLWHLAQPEGLSLYRATFETALQEIPKETPLVVALGEIDCRSNEGIWTKAAKTQKDPTDLAHGTFIAAFKYLSHALAGRQVIFCGLPAASLLRTQKDFTDTTRQQAYASFTRKADNLLRELTLKNGWDFLDIHTLTSDDSLWSHGRWHMDNTHLKPEGLIQAFSHHLILANTLQKVA